MGKIIERLRDAVAGCLYLILAGCALVAMWALDVFRGRPE